MTTVLQISDAHFGTERPDVVRALSELVAAQSPDLAVLSGDITQRARRGQFDAARRFIDSLPVASWLAIPGNHDIPLFNLFARIGAPYAGFKRAFGDDLEPVFESADLLVVALNTTRARRHKDGEVSREQIDRVSERLRLAATGQLCVVVVHQPVLAIRASDRRNLLHGHRQAVPAWADAGADLIMGGHIHLPYVRALREAFPDLSRATWAVQAGTCVSARTRDGIPNSVNLVRYDPAGAPRRCAVERWDYSAVHHRFDLQHRHELELEG